jgi:hypothetical protein
MILATLSFHMDKLAPGSSNNLHSLEMVLEVVRKCTKLIRLDLARSAVMRHHYDTVVKEIPLINPKLGASGC